MKIDIGLKRYGDQLADTWGEYDDTTQTMFVKRCLQKNDEGKIINVSPYPIIGSATVNGRKYTICIDSITNRPVSAFTMTKGANGNYDPRKFLTPQDYQEFLAGK